MTTDIHAASNAAINNFIKKQALGFDSLIALTGAKPYGLKLTRKETQISYEYTENGKHEFTIFVRYESEGFRINAYRRGMEEYDFRKLSVYDASRILKLIAFSMKAGN